MMGDAYKCIKCEKDMGYPELNPVVKFYQAIGRVVECNPYDPADVATCKKKVAEIRKGTA